jgi:cob(I)alamin adenosyltransferase
MSKNFKGKIVRSDLEGGYWTLEGDDGKTYKLDGGDGYKAGQHVEVEGTIDEGGFGIGFGSPTLVVKKVHAK